MLILAALFLFTIQIPLIQHWDDRSDYWLDQKHSKICTETCRHLHIQIHLIGHFSHWLGHIDRTPHFWAMIGLSQIRFPRPSNRQNYQSILISLDLRQPDWRRCMRIVVLFSPLTLYYKIFKRRSQEGKNHMSKTGTTESRVFCFFYSYSSTVLFLCISLISALCWFELLFTTPL